MMILQIKIKIRLESNFNDSRLTTPDLRLPTYDLRLS
jgi:hypothetical protein